MKILAIGDFHGKFPEKLKNKLKKQDFDLILSPGDLADSTTLRNLEFKYWHKSKSGFTLEDILGKNDYRRILQKMVLSMKRVLVSLKFLNRPIILIYGNSDVSDKEVKDYNFKGLESLCRSKGAIILKTNTRHVGDWAIAGFSGYRGAMSKGLTKSDGKQKKEIILINQKWEERLKKLFKKVKNFDKTLLLIHDAPFGCMDKVNYKKSPLNGKHVGDKYFLKYIKKFQPQVVLCGHMHEYQGVKKLGKSLVINPGPASEGKCAIIDIQGKDIKVKFYK